MKKLEIYHTLGGETLVVAADVLDDEATRVMEVFARLRANDGVFVMPNFAIPARSVELIKVVNQ